MEWLHQNELWNKGAIIEMILCMIRNILLLLLCIYLYRVLMASGLFVEENKNLINVS